MSNYYVHTIPTLTDLITNLELIYSDESVEDILELLHVLRVLVYMVENLACDDIVEEEI